MVFVILQWNARSLISNGQEFKHFIANCDVYPDVICIQETWLKPQLNFMIRWYETIRKDRNKGNGGGVATFIKQGIGFRKVEDNNDYEAVVVEVWEGNQSIRVINFYNPCDKLTKDMMENIGGIGDFKMVWCGDFNAHSTLWGSSNTDYNGLIIEDMLDWGELVCINDGSYTRVNLSQCKYSVLDLTIVSENVARRCDWKVLNENNIGSDHFPVCSTIGVDLIKTGMERVPKWNFKSGD